MWYLCILLVTWFQGITLKYNTYITLGIAITAAITTSITSSCTMFHDDREWVRLWWWVLTSLGGQKHDLCDPKKKVNWIDCATIEGVVTCDTLFLTHLLICLSREHIIFVLRQYNGSPNFGDIVSGWCIGYLVKLGKHNQMIMNMSLHNVWCSPPPPWERHGQMDGSRIAWF